MNSKHVAQMAEPSLCIQIRVWGGGGGGESPLIPPLTTPLHKE